MTQVADDTELKKSMSELDRLLQQVQSISDPAAKNITSGIIQSMMDFHGAGLSRILDHLSQAGEIGQKVIAELAEDEVVSNLLLLYGLHPLGIEQRVRQALEKVRPYLGSHGGNVQLLAVSEEGVVRIEMQGSCHSCPSSAVTVKNSIEQAIYDKAPDVTSIEVVEKEHEQVSPTVSGFVPIEQLIGGNGKKTIRQGALI